MRRRTRDEHCAGSWVGDHLVGDENSDVELVGNLGESREHFAESLLSVRQFSSSAEVHTE